MQMNLFRNMYSDSILLKLLIAHRQWVNFTKNIQDVFLKEDKAWRFI